MSRFAFAAPAVILLLSSLACSPIPEGYTKEGWDLFQRENPSEAEVLKWVAGNRSRARTRIAISHSIAGDEGSNPETLRRSDEPVCELARMCMEREMDFTQTARGLIQKQEDRAKNGLRSAQDDIKRYSDKAAEETDKAQKAATPDDRKEHEDEARDNTEKVQEANDYIKRCNADIEKAAKALKLLEGN